MADGRAAAGSGRRGSPGESPALEEWRMGRGEAGGRGGRGRLHGRRGPPPWPADGEREVGLGRRDGCEMEEGWGNGRRWKEGGGGEKK
jgi:hypothetical protein